MGSCWVPTVSWFGSGVLRGLTFGSEALDSWRSIWLSPCLDILLCTRHGLYVGSGSIADEADDEWI